jgi:DNA-binding beta-propeller fold protein YncE
MKRPLLTLGSLVLLPLAWCSGPHADPPAPRSAYRSPLGLAVDQHGKRAYVALHTAATVAVVDLEAGKVLSEIPVGRGPHDLVLAGDKLFVTCDADDSLVILNAARGAILKKLRVGQAPRGVTVAPDGGQAFIACHDARILQSVGLADGNVQSLPLPGWPDRLVFQADVEHPYLMALSSQAGEAAVTVIRAGPPPRIWASRLLPGITNARGLVRLSPSYVVLAHQKPRTQIPTTQVAQGWVFTNTISILSPWIDTPTAKSAAAKPLDDPYRSNADPSDVALSADLRYAFVACAGADTVLAVCIDKAVVGIHDGEARSGWKAKDTPHGREDLSSSRLYVSARLPTQANPRRLALSGDGSRLVVSNYLGDSLTVMDAKQLRVLRHIPLGGPAPDAARRGQIQFNSARMTFQGQFSCASCHPDGGADGLNWDLTRDGVGNFMNTRSLLGVKDTAPYGWHGSSPTLADRFTGTLRTLHRHEPTAAETSDLTAYLESLPPPRPLPQRPEDRPAAVRGKLLFEGKGGCITCHRGVTFQDGLTHDLGTRGPQDVQDRFDTPSLRGVARTAPYLHDGRAGTLEDVFTRHNTAQRHGAAHRLTAEELRDVIAYLKSL